MSYCKNNHEFNTQNSYTNSYGHRICRPCNAQRQREYRQRASSAYREKMALTHE